MNLSNGPWQSYSFHNKRPVRDFKHSHMELQYDEYKRPEKNPYASKRLELQKQRVYDATLKRVLQKKELLEKERLFHVYSKGIKLESVAADFPEELPDFIKYYYITCGLDAVDDEKLYNKYKRIAELKTARTRNDIKRSRGLRPASAYTYRQHHPPDIDAKDDNAPVKIEGKKRVRIRSAPTSQVFKNGVKMVSQATQDDGHPLYDYTNRSRSGCQYCPVECRPISSSSSDQRSSTGLQATPGPSHYQYFHYKKYFYYQRPRSAIGERMEYLEGLGVTDKLRRTPRFSKFAYACKMHDRDSNRASPRSRSPRSPTSTESTRSRRPVRQAWMGGRSTPEGSDIKSLVDDGDVDSFKEVLKGDIHPPSDEASGSVDDLEDDLKYTDEMRHLAEQAASCDQFSVQKNEGDDSMNSSGFVPIRVPTPTPAQSQSPSSVEEQPALVKPSFYKPAVPESTDMLSGRVFVPGLEISTDEVASVEEEEMQVPPMIIQIQAPKPLPVKRIPQPEVHEVDVVSPREELGAAKEDEELEKFEEFDDGFPTDRTVTISDVESIPEEVPVTTSEEKEPISILKSVSTDSKPATKPPRVSFDLVIKEVEEPTLSNENIIDEARVVSSIGKEEEKEAFKVIPEIVLERDSPVKDITVPVADVRTDSKPSSPVPPSMQTSVVITTPEPSPEKPAPTIRKPLKLYGEPDDVYVRKLLAPPDLKGFVAPVFDTPPPKIKKKKRLGSGKKKKKGKKKTAEKIPAENTPQEPLFTYVRRSEREKAKLEQQFNMKEDYELQKIVTSVRQFDESYKEKMKNQPWLFGRMALSKQICRFWLPMDLRDLEDDPILPVTNLTDFNIYYTGVSPSRYLLDYCIVCQRRRKLYVATYDRQLHKRKMKMPRAETLSVKEAEAALRSVHGDIISDQDVAGVFELLCINENARSSMYVDQVDKSLFANLCALTERIFYDKFVTEDSEMNENSQRHRIEIADFGGIEWKIQNIHLSKELKRFLVSL